MRPDYYGYLAPALMLVLEPAFFFNVFFLIITNTFCRANPARWRNNVQAATSSARGRTLSCPRLLPSSVAAQRPGHRCGLLHAHGGRPSWPLPNTRNPSRTCKIRSTCCVLARKANHTHLHTHTPELSRSPGPASL